MDWSDILKVMLGAGIGTAIVEGGISLFQFMKTGRSQGAFLAFRLAVQLEGYARGCLSHMHDTKNYMSSKGNVGRLHCYLPPFPDFPDDPEGWRNVSPQILDMAFRLKVDAEGINSGLDFWVKELGEVENAFDDCYTGCGKMGLAALGASKSFRQFYGFKEYPDDTKEQLEECLGSPPKAFYSMD
jgi:hypothetical protein